MEKASPSLSFWGVSLPKCPKCGEELEAVYPLDLKTLWVDFWLCPKCKTAYEPKKLKPIAHVV